MTNRQTNDKLLLHALVVALGLCGISCGDGVSSRLGMDASSGSGAQSSFGGETKKGCEESSPLRRIFQNVDNISLMLVAESQKEAAKESLRELKEEIYGNELFSQLIEGGDAKRIRALIATSGLVGKVHMTVAYCPTFTDSPSEDTYEKSVELRNKEGNFTHVCHPDSIHVHALLSPEYAECVKDGAYNETASPEKRERWQKTLAALGIISPQCLFSGHRGNVFVPLTNALKELDLPYQWQAFFETSGKFAGDDVPETIKRLEEYITKNGGDTAIFSPFAKLVTGLTSHLEVHTKQTYVLLRESEPRLELSAGDDSTTAPVLTIALSGKDYRLALIPLDVLKDFARKKGFKLGELAEGALIRVGSQEQECVKCLIPGNPGKATWDKCIHPNFQDLLAVVGHQTIYSSATHFPFPFTSDYVK